DILKKAGKFVSVPFTFLVLVTGWVLFRNEDLSYAGYALKQMFAFNFFKGEFAMNNDFVVMAVIAALFSFFTLFKKGQLLQDNLYSELFPLRRGWATVIGGIVLFYVSLSYVSALDFNPFIY